jgi:hypothetical protein
VGKLEGKISLITGANSGIGLATAAQFVREGAYVFMTGRRDAELAAAVKEIGKNVAGVKGDVSNLGDLDRLFAEIKREKGKLDIVFANAGMAQYAPLAEITGGALRANLRHQREGCPVHRAEGTAADAGRRRHHPQRVNRWQQGSEQRVQRHQGRRAVICAYMDDRFEAPAHSRQRREPGHHRDAGTQRSAGLLAGRGTAPENGFPTPFRLAGSARPTRSPKPWCFSHPTTQATSPERNCSWMVASPRFRRSGTSDPNRNSPCRPGSMCALCWMSVSDQKRAAA